MATLLPLALTWARFVEHLDGNWMWEVPLLFWVLFELYALATRIPGFKGKRIPTLSQRVWWAYDRFAGLPHAVLAVFLALYLHFFVYRRRKPPKG